MAAFDYATRQADLTNKYNQENALQQFGRMLGQQQFARQKDLMNQGFQRQFPRFTGQAARRLGSGVQSGVFREQLGQNVNDYMARLGQLESGFAGREAQFLSDQAAREDAYRRMLLALDEDRQRALQGGM